MEFDRSEWLDMITKRAKGKRLHEMMPAIRKLAMAEVEADKLTGSPEWDMFLQMIQVRIDDCQTMLDGVGASIMRKGLHGDDLMDIRTEAIQIQERLDTLLYVKDLPKTLLDNGVASARQIVAEESDADLERAGAVV